MGQKYFHHGQIGCQRVREEICHTSLKNSDPRGRKKGGVAENLIISRGIGKDFNDNKGRDIE